MCYLCCECVANDRGSKRPQTIVKWPHNQVVQEDDVEDVTDNEKMMPDTQAVLSLRTPGFTSSRRSWLAPGLLPGDDLNNNQNEQAPVAPVDDDDKVRIDNAMTLSRKLLETMWWGQTKAQTTAP